MVESPFDTCIYLGLLFDADANGTTKSPSEGLDLGHLEGKELKAGDSGGGGLLAKGLGKAIVVLSGLASQ